MAAERQVCSYSTGTESCPSFFKVILELLPLSTFKSMYWVILCCKQYMYFKITRAGGACIWSTINNCEPPRCKQIEKLVV